MSLFFVKYSELEIWNLKNWSYAFSQVRKDVVFIGHKYRFMYVAPQQLTVVVFRIVSTAAAEQRHTIVLYWH